jgi:hypothetical protein
VTPPRHTVVCNPAAFTGDYVAVECLRYLVRPPGTFGLPINTLTDKHRAGDRSSVHVVLLAQREEHSERAGNGLQQDPRFRREVPDLHSAVRIWFGWPQCEVAASWLTMQRAAEVKVQSISSVYSAFAFAYAAEQTPNPFSHPVRSHYSTAGHSRRTAGARARAGNHVGFSARLVPLRCACDSEVLSRARRVDARQVVEAFLPRGGGILCGGVHHGFHETLGAAAQLLAGRLVPFLHRRPR